MRFAVRELPRAKFDKRHIFAWLFERSRQGASAWLDAYDQMVIRLAADADTFPDAIENDDVELHVKQVLFRTRRGRFYRALFLIDGHDVFILRVRGPGQSPVDPGELGGEH